MDLVKKYFKGDTVLAHNILPPRQVSHVLIRAGSASTRCLRMVIHVMSILRACGTWPFKVLYGWHGQVPQTRVARARRSDWECPSFGYSRRVGDGSCVERHHKCHNYGTSHPSPTLCR